jgi:DNA invertase Pin-like site-specific DNA recombinase
MKAAIYMRTSKKDKAHNAFTIARQEEHTRDLASKHGLQVAYEHVFSDLDYPGDAPPACWANSYYDGITRPALEALIHAVENDPEIHYLIVRRMDRLGTSSEILTNLLHFLSQHEINIVATPENQDADLDPVESFAIDILKPILRYDTQEEVERKNKLRQRKVEEIERLKDKVHRLEAEIRELET